MSTNPDGLPTSEVLYSESPIDLSVPYDATTVKGKTIIITGGASGLGAGMFRKFASLGCATPTPSLVNDVPNPTPSRACVIIGDLNTHRGEALAVSLRASTGNPQYAPSLQSPFSGPF